jgi:hypothetical protein
MFRPWGLFNFDAIEEEFCSHFLETEIKLFSLFTGPESRSFFC